MVGAYQHVSVTVVFVPGRLGPRQRRLESAPAGAQRTEAIVPFCAAGSCGYALGAHGGRTYYGRVMFWKAGDMASGVFVTAINCIDGRVQVPVMDWMKTAFGADYVDVVTEPGPEKALTEGSEEREASIREKVAVSVNAHKSAVVAVAAHFDCAGNPVSEQQHKQQVGAASETIQRWGFPVRVVGLWVGDGGSIEVVGDTAGHTH